MVVAHALPGRACRACGGSRPPRRAATSRRCHTTSPGRACPSRSSLIAAPAADARPAWGRDRSVVSHNPALRAHGWAGALRGCGASIEDALNEAVGDVLQFELRPQLRLKLRKRTPWLSLGANVEAGEPGVELVAKRGTRPQGGLALWKARFGATLARQNSHLTRPPRHRAARAPRGRVAREARRARAQARAVRGRGEARDALHLCPLACSRRTTFPC